MNPFCELAVNLRDEGVDQKTIYHAFHDLFKEHQAPVGVEDYHWEDDITDSLDYICGYCSPHMKLFPDGMNWKELENG